MIQNLILVLNLLLIQNLILGCLVLFFESCLHESFEERMWTVRPGFELRMCLCRNEPRMGRDLDHLDDAAVRRESAQRHPVFLQDVAVIVVYFIAVAVAFADLSCAVQFLGEGAFFEHARICAEAERASNVFHTDLIRHDVDDRMGGIRFQLHAVRVIITDYISGELYDGELHARHRPRNGIRGCGHI